MMTKTINHLCRFEEMLCSAEALPAGDMPTPNGALKIEWFCMSFHQEDRTRDLKSELRLCDETLETVAKYFNNIYNSQVTDGSLMKKREKQIKFHAKRKFRHKMAKRYNNKIRNFANQRYGCNDCRHEHGHLHRRTYNKKYICCNHDNHQGHRDCKSPYKCNNRSHKSLPEHDDKNSKLCHVHGPKSQHFFKKCFKNPKNQDKNSYDKKRNYKAHHNNECIASKDKESCASVDSPPASDSPTLHSEDKEQRKEEQYRVHFEKKIKADPQMTQVPCKRKGVKPVVSTTLKKKSPTFLDDNLDLGFDLDFGDGHKDSVLMGLNSLIALDDVVNPFDFK
jgi:hypothetical protein